MLQNYNKYKVLKVFLHHPTEQFRLRELSKISTVPPVSLNNYLASSIHEKLVKKYVKNKIPFYQAERDTEQFKFYQKISTLYELNQSGFIQALWEECSPEAIILFGSHSRGEAIESSDIDIAILGKKTSFRSEQYEKKLGKKIELHFYPTLSAIPKELRNNILNGCVLKGYIEAFP